MLTSDCRCLCVWDLRAEVRTIALYTGMKNGLALGIVTVQNALPLMLSMLLNKLLPQKLEHERCRALLIRLYALQCGQDVKGQHGAVFQRWVVWAVQQDSGQVEALVGGQAHGCLQAQERGSGSIQPIVYRQSGQACQAACADTSGPIKAWKLCQESPAAITMAIADKIMRSSSFGWAYQLVHV